MRRLAPGMIGWILALTLLAGCGGGRATDYYQNQALEQSPEQTLAFEGNVNETCFSDELVDINININNDDTQAFDLDLTNKTPAPIVVHWEKVVFLDASGNRQYMIHQGVAYWDSLSELQPTTLPPSASLHDVLGPAKLEDRDGAQRLAPLSGAQDTSVYLDQRVRIDLPLEVLGRLNVYRFRFHVEQAPVVDPFLGEEREVGP